MTFRDYRNWAEDYLRGFSADSSLRLTCREINPEFNASNHAFSVRCDVLINNLRVIGVTKTGASRVKAAKRCLIGVFIALRAHRHTLIRQLGITNRAQLRNIHLRYSDSSESEDSETIQ